MVLIFEDVAEDVTEIIDGFRPLAGIMVLIELGGINTSYIR